MKNKERLILFDLGGVLINWKDKWLFEEIEFKYKIPLKTLVKRFDIHRDKLFTGKILEYDFWKIVLKDYFDNNLEKLEIIDQIFQQRSSINHKVFSLAKKLKKENHKIGILSNIIPQTRQTLTEKNIFDFFEYAFFSDLIGFARPNPEIFDYVKRQLNMPLNNIMLIDDKKENIKAADQAGLTTIHYKKHFSLDSQIQHFLN